MFSCRTYRCIERSSFLTRAQSSLSASSFSSSGVVFSGIQPTGIPHLGNYLGAIRQWLRLQQEAPASTKILFSIVDLHAITTPQDRPQLRRWKKETLAALLAVGLDPERCTIFYQSDVSAHTELFWILSCTASIGYLSRMTQWKSKLALDHDATLSDNSARAKLKLGLFAYPVLQAADILVHGATHVPVGVDQAQHIEFTRECATNFNTLHGECLVKPTTIFSPTGRIMSLRNPEAKMSKSHKDTKSRILLSDSDDEIKLKIQKAITDSKSGISYDTSMRPGISNLVNILLGVQNSSMEPEHAVSEVLQGLTVSSFKDLVTSEIINDIAPIRKRFLDFLERDEWLAKIAADGAQRARDNSAGTLERVRNALGF